ncbi:MAG: transglutaminase family protein, partial [Planctomycetaceae bacterium]|nr:transglutaminase family protein [Planctomycetaceae bacterium]
QPAYEDVYYYLWREQQLPINLDPRRNNLDDPVERHRVSQVFDRGLGAVVSYILPLKVQQQQADAGRGRWVSDQWTLRRGNLFLLPGDSSVGYRLPLPSLPWAEPGEEDPLVELDPLAPRGPLPRRHPDRTRRQSISSRTETPRLPGGPDAGELRDHWAVGQSVSGVVRTALCVEPRDGRLYVFVPPQRILEDYLDLISAIEATAQELRMPVIIEGYRPPSDSRLNHFGITPDPGVIEVNIHPSRSWDELVTKTTILYEQARLTRLGTEKFMLDGRHTGTGGGNHVILGGPTPADSPILRRPDLLRSLITYWHNHPSLSYLFSGLFVGPHSQAPRLDEARNDSLYEMEIAFREIPDGGGAPPWLVDRVFRHLLVDVTGNTHRAEFCIDKLYNPDTASGRLGLVEMRAFEMPPHARMSLAQQLLIRGLVARFWENPVCDRLIPWGTDLHDRFMLPHFIDLDFQDVIQEMIRAGYPFRSEWFAPHFEFRFPGIGSIQVAGVELELRQAIEPWHVLGEESTSSGTARYVDSSVERLQVEARGLTEGRQVLTCNGRRVPLHPTGTCGEYVAGVRYRAWQPPSCLHPTVKINSPLVFDIWDPWLKRSVGGCTYHVVHPGGLSYETFPVNANEAESRRQSRFFPFGHTPGETLVPPLERHPSAPLTLDLRRIPTGLGSLAGDRPPSGTEFVV